MKNINLDYRFATKQNSEKIKKAYNIVKNKKDNNLLSETELNNILYDVYNNILYEDIKNGLIIDAENIGNMLIFYSIDKKEPKKVKYLSWLLNKYYPTFSHFAIDKFIDSEHYEEADIMKKSLLISKIPIEIE